ncbi:MAG: polysaccharide biosynthesis/export family protein [bacterium]|nr:polysaccharide biosynthesis/export family protein [bacterium]
MNIKKFILSLCMLFIFILFYICAINFNQAAAAAASLGDEAYKVGPLDVLRITVAGKPGIDALFTISDDGLINFPLIGEVTVSGLTVQEIKQKITDLLGKDYLVDPKVFVSIEKYNSQKVIVWGEVKSPGVYVLTGRTTLLEIIAQAGGITDRAGKRITLFHNALDPKQREGVSVAEIVGSVGQKDALVIDIDQLVQKRDLSERFLVSSGDVIIVEAQKDSDINQQRVYITGCLARPGSYEYQNGLTALSLCIIAGGFSDRAAPQKATLIRNIDGKDIVYKIDLNKIKSGQAADFKLKPGDRLNVPESFW